MEGEQPRAILVLFKNDGKGEEIHVLVEDPAGRMHARRCFLFQLGTAHISYMDGKPKKAIVPDSAKVMFTFVKAIHRRRNVGLRKEKCSRIIKEIAESRAKVDFLDVRPPTRRAEATDSLQVLVFIKASAWVQILRASGMDGVLSDLLSKTITIVLFTKRCRCQWRRACQQAVARRKL